MQCNGKRRGSGSKDRKPNTSSWIRSIRYIQRPPALDPSHAGAGSKLGNDYGAELP